MDTYTPTSLSEDGKRREQLILLAIAKESERRRQHCLTSYEIAKSMMSTTYGRWGRIRITKNVLYRCYAWRDDECRFLDVDDVGYYDIDPDLRIMFVE